MDNKKKEIVFINQSSGYLMVDIVNAHEDYFSERILLTGSLTNQDSLSNDVKVKKIKKYDRSSTFKRLVSWCFAFIQIVWIVKIHHRGAYLFIVSNPPFGTFLPLICSNKFSLLIYDIYPDILVEYGIIKSNSSLVKLWEKINNKVYRRAEKIFTISEGMKDRLSNYMSAKSIDVIPLWANEDNLKPIPREGNKFIKENELSGKFIVLYSGNLGRTHDLETLIYAAEKLDRDDILFLIIGGGDKQEKLSEMIRRRKLSNVMMKPWQPIEMLYYTLNSAHLGVVTLGSGASDLSLPSKTFNYLRVGVPLLCIAEHTSELSKLVLKHDVGTTFRPDEIDRIIEFITSCADNKQKYESICVNVGKASANFSSGNAKRFVNQE